MVEEYLGDVYDLLGAPDEGEGGSHRASVGGTVRPSLIPTSAVNNGTVCVQRHRGRSPGPSRSPGLGRRSVSAEPTSQATSRGRSQTREGRSRADRSASRGPGCVRAVNGVNFWRGRVVRTGLTG